MTAQIPRKIRVLHFAGIINRHDFIDSVLSRLDRSRFEVSAITSIPPRRTGVYSSNTTYPNRVLGFPFCRSTFLRTVTALVREVREFRPHILQSHHYTETLAAAMVVRRCGIPGFVIGHHYSDHIYVLAKGLKRQVYLAGEAFCNRTANRVVVPAADVAELLTARQGVPATKVAVIPYGFDFGGVPIPSPEAVGRIRTKHDLHGKFVIVTSCRLNREKGLDYLLRAIPKVKSHRSAIRVMMLGDGPYASRLRHLSRELGVENAVEFVGWQNDAMDWIAAADVVVQPSLSESFCQVLLEAAFCGKPVVMTPVGAAPDFIGQNERGCLVPPEDTDAIAEALIRLMKDRRRARELGCRAQKYLKEQMGAGTSARAYMELYEAVLSEALTTRLRHRRIHHLNEEKSSTGCVTST